MLGQPRGLVSELSDPPRELDLRGTGSRDQSSVLEQAPDGVDSVVDRSLEVVEVVGGRASKDDGCGSGSLLSLLSQNGDSVSSDLDGLEDVDVSSLFRGGSSNSGERGGSADSAKTTEVELGKNFEDSNALSVKVVKGKVSDTGSSDDQLDSRVGNLLEDLWDREGWQSAKAKGRELEPGDSRSPSASPLPW